MGINTTLSRICRLNSGGAKLFKIYGFEIIYRTILVKSYI